MRRKKKASFQKMLETILSTKVSVGTVPATLLKTPKGENITYGEAVLLAQLLKACGGDTSAANFIRDTSGNKIKEGTTDKEIPRFEDL